MSFAFWVIFGFCGVLIAHTVLREIGVPSHLLPLYPVFLLGRLVESVYYWIGKSLGYVWYLSCHVCRFVASYLYDALSCTISDLYYSIKPYFHFSRIWTGIREVGWDFWQAHRVAIRRGAIGLICSTSLIWLIKRWMR